VIAIIYLPLTCTLSTFSCCATSAPELKPPGSGTTSDSWDLRRYKKNTKRQKTWSNDLQWKSLLHCFIQTLKLKRVPKKNLPGLMDCEIDITALRLRTSGLDATVVLVASSGCLFRVIYTKQPNSIHHETCHGCQRGCFNVGFHLSQRFQISTIYSKETSLPEATR